MIFSSFKWNNETTLELTGANKAYLYFRNSRTNLLTGWPEVCTPEDLQKELNTLTLQSEVTSPTVIHLFYELGLIFHGLGHSLKDDTPLALIIEYSDARKKKISTPRLKSIPLRSLERPTWSEYKGAFSYIQERLLKGECYQVNLTFPYDFETEDLYDPRDLSAFLMAQKGAGAFAHATYYGEEMVLSNSPECLFQCRNEKIVTMPIKGTMERGRDWKKDWKKMLASPKEEAELIMITDLLRNDLNRIGPPQARVEKMRAPLLVPGLIHQYSLISLKLREEISLLKALESLFPGGSVTGAPKKKVMQIIQQVERYERGHYCGSTILLWKKKKAASINIRTATIDPGERLWTYGAGGGVTLLSRAADEYQEMEAKVRSFLTLLKAPGY